MIFLKDGVLDHLERATDEPDLSGTKYRLLHRLGRGGMGSVYAVEDVELGREVALKVASNVHLTREARVLAKLEHPGIVPIHDAGELPDGRVFYVMKLVRGERLDRHLARRPDLRSVLRLFQKICEAVAFAHAQGVLHRDLKPENIMVGEFGEALVMDWGIARSPEDSEGDGTVLGTPGYMSPEQARGELASLDARTDVYALGAILRGLDALPRPLVAIATKATADSREDRYPTPLDLAADLGAYLDGDPVSAYRETIVERTGRFLQRHRVLASLLAVYLAVRLLIALVS